MTYIVDYNITDMLLSQISEKKILCDAKAFPEHIVRKIIRRAGSGDARNIL